MTQSFTHKYKTEIDAALNGACDCPSANAQPLTKVVTVYRWTHDPCTGASFVPQAVTDPSILTRGRVKNDCDGQCGYFSLSFHVTEQESRAAWKHIVTFSKNFASLVGSSVARGTLNPGEGLVTPVDRKGHLEFHQEQSIAWDQRFSIIGNLP